MERKEGRNEKGKQKLKACLPSTGPAGRDAAELLGTPPELLGSHFAAISQHRETPELVTSTTSPELTSSSEALRNHWGPLVL